MQRQMIPAVSAIGTAVLGLLGTVAPALVGDVYATGLILVGGGSQLRGVDRLLRDLTGLAVVQAPEPGTHTVRGLASMLGRMPLLATVAS